MKMTSFQKMFLLTLVTTVFLHPSSVLRSEDISSDESIENVDKGIFRGPHGKRGERGTKGRTGPRGRTGEKGRHGETGRRGPRGFQGDVGEIGATGPTGASGILITPVASADIFTESGEPWGGFSPSSSWIPVPLNSGHPTSDVNFSFTPYSVSTKGYFTVKNDGYYAINYGLIGYCNKDLADDIRNPNSDIRLCVAVSLRRGSNPFTRLAAAPLCLAAYSLGSPLVAGNGQCLVELKANDQISLSLYYNSSASTGMLFLTSQVLVDFAADNAPLNRIATLTIQNVND
jgi:hypothetical protein